MNNGVNVWEKPAVLLTDSYFSTLVDRVPLKLQPWTLRTLHFAQIIICGAPLFIATHCTGSYNAVYFTVVPLIVAMNFGNFSESFSQQIKKIIYISLLIIPHILALETSSPVYVSVGLLAYRFFNVKAMSALYYLIEDINKKIIDYQIELSLQKQLEEIVDPIDTQDPYSMESLITQECGHHFFANLDEYDFIFLARTSKKIKNLLPHRLNLTFTSPFLRKIERRRWLWLNMHNENLPYPFKVILIAKNQPTLHKLFTMYSLPLRWTKPKDAFEGDFLTENKEGTTQIWSKKSIKRLIRSDPYKALKDIHDFSLPFFVECYERAKKNNPVLYPAAVQQQSEEAIQQQKEESDKLERFYQQTRDFVFLELYKVFLKKDPKKCDLLFDLLSLKTSKALAILIRTDYEWIHGIFPSNKNAEMPPSFEKEIVDKYKIGTKRFVLQEAQALVHLFNTDQAKLFKTVKSIISWEQHDPTKGNIYHKSNEKAYLKFIEYQMHHYSEASFDTLNVVNASLKQKAYQKIAFILSKKNIPEALKIVRLLPTTDQIQLLFHMSTQQQPSTLKEALQANALVQKAVRRFSQDFPLHFLGRFISQF